MELAQIEDQFVDVGATFISSSFDIREKLNHIKAYLFDWDGVFNDGSKRFSSEGSTFSEVDSAGLRMLRYSHYRKFGEVPYLGVITGAQNPGAAALMASHGADVIYQRAIRKREALEHFLNEHDLKAEEVCYMYDDALDLNVAAEVGLRFCVGRLANPIFIGLVQGSGLADYITACQGNEHAVREVSELIMILQEEYTAVIQELMNPTEHYLNFRSLVQERVLKKYEYLDKEFHLDEG